MDRRNTLTGEWHSRNEHGFDKYTNGSKFKAWWTCSDCNHEWQATIANRIGKCSGCPNCRKLKVRGNNNPKWTGYGDIGGRQWLVIEREAKRRKLPFQISIEYAWEVFLEQERKCVLTGKVLTMWGKRNGTLVGNASLDLIDATEGFVEGNVQWIDKRLQHVKGGLSGEDFIQLCTEVAAYQAAQRVSSFVPPSFKEWTSLQEL